MKIFTIGYTTRIDGIIHERYIDIDGETPLHAIFVFKEIAQLHDINGIIFSVKEKPSN